MRLRAAAAAAFTAAAFTAAAFTASAFTAADLTTSLFWVRFLQQCRRLPGTS